LISPITTFWYDRLSRSLENVRFRSKVSRSACPVETRVLGYQAAAIGIGVLILETSGGFLAGISWRACLRR
jgi:hypothetical protein